MDSANRDSSSVHDPGGRPAVLLTRGDDRVLVATDGAQVLSWHRGGREVLWSASHAEYRPGKPVRAGIPLVFPWFGDHARDAKLPAHGFARNLLWQVATTRPGPELVLTASDTPATLAMWPHAFGLQLTVTLSSSLRIAFRVENRGAAAFSFEEAMHTYFATGDVHTTSVHGLEGVPCTEHAAAPEPDWRRDQPLHFRAETDRIFQGVPDRLTIRAPALRRSIGLRTSNAHSTIVWNPWPAKTARLAQMAADDWRHFVCVETGNVKEHAVRLAPGQHHLLELELSVGETAGS